jgi:hypothetical protein
MIKHAESFQDAVRNIFTSIGDAFINTVTRMIAQWMIFGSITGGKGGISFGGTSGGYGGLIGLIGSLFAAQEGGIFDRPTPALIGEAGPEAVVPLKGGKIPIEGGRGVTNVTYNSFKVYADDPRLFEEKHATSIMNVIKSSAKVRGQMHDIIKEIGR